MRVHILTLWWVVAGVALALLMAGSITGHTTLRAWGLGIGLVAFGLWRRKADIDNENWQEAQFRRWAAQPYESGWHARGVSDQIRR